MEICWVRTGLTKKQRPWDESILVPFLIRYPELLGKKGEVIDKPINAPDIMPTLLSLCGVSIPESAEGEDYSDLICDGKEPDVPGALLECIHPFGQWHRGCGGREYRGLRTERYTYVRDRNGPWLLYDNEKDPYQIDNLCGKEEYRKTQDELESYLNRMLEQRGDEFLPGEAYIDMWGYETDETGTVPYSS